MTNTIVEFTWALSVMFLEKMRHNTNKKSMRKRYKKKKQSCALCKPHKMNWEIRWKAKEFFSLKEFELEKSQII